MQTVLRPPSFRLGLSSSLCRPAVPCAPGSQHRPAQAYVIRATQPDSSFTWTERPRNDREWKEFVLKLHAWQEENRERLEKQLDELEYWVSVMARQAEDPEYIVPAAEVLTWGEIRPELKQGAAYKRAQAKLEGASAD